MDKLPVEVLQDIFRLSLSHPDKKWELSPYFTGPLIISHVCRYWRWVSISFGTLWTYLETSYGCPRIKYDMVHTWIERTNGLPLDFEIEYQLEDDDDIEQRRTLESVTKLLLAEQYRWRRVRFGWVFKAFSPEFTRIDMTNMPMLLSLSLDIDIRKCDDGDRILPNVSLALSRSVEEVSFYAEYDIDYGTEPLQHLRDKPFRFRGKCWNDARAAKSYLDALQAYPNLKKFDVLFEDPEFHHDPEQEMPDNRPHLVHGIEELVLEDTDGDFPELVIGKVTLPNLRVLGFKTSSFSEIDSALSELFQRSNPPLESLELYGKCAQPQNLIPALHHLPSLETLVIECCRNPELMFEGLSSTVGGSVICPKLLRLHLKEYGYGSDVPDPRRALDALCALVELRGNPASPGRITVDNDFVIPTSHIRGEFGLLLEVLSMTRRAHDLHVTFECLDRL